MIKKKFIVSLSVPKKKFFFKHHFSSNKKIDKGQKITWELPKWSADYWDYEGTTCISHWKKGNIKFKKKTQVQLWQVLVTTDHMEWSKSLHKKYLESRAWETKWMMVSEKG